MAVTSSALGTMPRSQGLPLNRSSWLPAAKEACRGKRLRPTQMLPLLQPHFLGLASDPEELFPMLPAYRQEKLCSGWRIVLGVFVVSSRQALAPPSF